jgi:hypothetical protein
LKDFIVVEYGGYRSHEGWDVNGGALVGRLNAVGFLHFVGTRAKSIIDGVGGMVVYVIL